MTIKIKEDKAFVNKMLKAIRDNDGYCPCRIQKTEDTKCLCKEFLGMEEGTCHCGLYTKYKE